MMITYWYYRFLLAIVDKDLGKTYVKTIAYELFSMFLVFMLSLYFRSITQTLLMQTAMQSLLISLTVNLAKKVLE